jgi:hypothetical protein
VLQLVLVWTLPWLDRYLLRISKYNRKRVEIILKLPPSDQQSTFYISCTNILDEVIAASVSCFLAWFLKVKIQPD